MSKKSVAAASATRSKVTIQGKKKGSASITVKVEGKKGNVKSVFSLVTKVKVTAPANKPEDKTSEKSTEDNSDLL